MKIILGSLSKDKLKILEDYLEENKINDFNIIQKKADSEVSEQPLSEQETLLGAKNRAINAFNSEACNLAIGLEGGLLQIDNLYHLICVACYYDGSNLYIGTSHPLPLPEEVSSAVKNGQQFGEIIRDYVNHKSASDDLSELISRRKSFASAIHDAFSKIPKSSI